MLLNPLVIAKACLDIYNDDTKDFDLFWCFPGLFAGYKQIGDTSLIAVRGSHNPGDWFRNLWVAPVWDDALGHVHPGFNTNVADLLVAMMQAGAIINFKRTVVGGHSRGGAQARLLAGRCAVVGTPIECCVFGSPKPADSNLGRVLDKGGKEHRSYANQGDPVVTQPIGRWLGKGRTVFDYEHTEEAFDLESHAAPKDFDPFRNHYMPRYVDGLGAIDPQNVVATPPNSGLVTFP